MQRTLTIIRFQRHSNWKTIENDSRNGAKFLKANIDHLENAWRAHGRNHWFQNKSKWGNIKTSAAFIGKWS